MAPRTYHPRQFLHVPILSLFLVVLLVPLALYMLDIMSLRFILALALGLAAVAAILVSWRERQSSIEYVLSDAGVLMRRKGAEEVMPFELLVDVNLMDREDARAYMNRFPNRSQGRRNIITRGTFTRFCTAEISLGGLLNWFAGQLRSTPHGGRMSYVLLRSRDGRQRLLSPKHSEDLVHAINRALQPKSAQLTLF